MNPRFGLNKLKKKNLIYVIVFIFCILILAGFLPFFRAPLLNVYRFPLIFLNLIRRQVKALIFHHQNFIQNEGLKKEVYLLKQRLNTFEELRLENTRLKNLLGFQEKSSYKVIPARVIGRSLDNWSSLVIIDKGRKHGIKLGLVVINHLGLVGRVSSTTEFSSKIMLLNDPNMGVSGMVQRSRQEGLVSGSLGSSLMMRYLPQEADIRKTDTIITSGLTPLYPKGILIGTVVDMGEEFPGLSQYAIIKPVVDLSSIEEVLVIIQ